MNAMLKLVVSLTLLLAGGSWTVPAGANEVEVTDDVSWPYPSDPDLDVFHVRCTQMSNLMCVALVNWDTGGTVLATAVVASPSGLVGQAWAGWVPPYDVGVHCFAAPGTRKHHITGYVTASLNSAGPIVYELRAQCWSGNADSGYTTRGTAITKTQDQ